MVKITGRGVAAGMRNLMAMREADRQEKNRKEEVLMGIFAKYGVSGLNGLFPGEDVSKEALNTDLEDDSLTNTSSFSQTLSETNAMKKLARNREDGGYELDQTTIAAIKANGDPTAFKRLYEMVDKKAKYFQEIGEEIPVDYLRTVVDQAVMTSASSSGKINFKKMEDYVGRELDDLSKAIIMQASEAQNRGEILFTDVNYAKKIDINDLKEFEIKALESNLTRAETEKIRLTSTLAELTEKSGPAFVGAKAWLTERKALIEDATKQYSQGSVLPLVRLYGTSYANKLYEYYPRFKGAPINEAILEASKEIMTVPNTDVAGILQEEGYLKPGEIVLNSQTNRPLPIPSNFRNYSQGPFNKDYWENGEGKIKLEEFRNLLTE